jgi:hypothetical protein
MGRWAMRSAFAERVSALHISDVFSRLTLNLHFAERESRIVETGNGRLGAPMQTIAFSSERVLVGEISADRKRHTQRGYFAVVFVTVLGAAVSWYFYGGVFETVTAAAFALGVSAITAAIINTDHHIYYGRASSRTSRRH